LLILHLTNLHQHTWYLWWPTRILQKCPGTVWFLLELWKRLVQATSRGIEGINIWYIFHGLLRLNFLLGSNTFLLDIIQCRMLYLDRHGCFVDWVIIDGTFLKMIVLVVLRNLHIHLMLCIIYSSWILRVSERCLI